MLLNRLGEFLQLRQKHQNPKVINLRNVDGGWLCIGGQDTTYDVDGVVKPITAQADASLATINVKIVEKSAGGLCDHALRHSTVRKLNLKGGGFIGTRIRPITDIGNHRNRIVLYIPKHCIHQV